MVLVFLIMRVFKNFLSDLKAIAIKQSLQAGNIAIYHHLLTYKHTAGDLYFIIDNLPAMPPVINPKPPASDTQQELFT